MTAVTVIGNGPAAHRLLQRLHGHGYRGTLTVLGAELEPAYNRALLTNVLDGTLPAASLSLAEPPPGVLLRTGVRATSVDLRQRRVRSESGEEFPYDVLVLATGARTLVPTLPGAANELAPGIRTLRTLDDARPVREDPVVVAGGGLRGVETAHALSRAGHDVTLVHPGPRPMHRLLDEQAGALLTRALGESGAAQETGRRVVAVEGGKVVLDNGRLLAAGTLLLCTGSTPDTALARSAGLTVRNGVVVDEQLRTSDPHVYAIGDCVGHDSDSTLPAAWDQADALAGILAGKGGAWRPARQVVRPRLHGLDVVVAGPPDGLLAPDHEHVVLSDPARHRYGRLVLRDGRVHAAVLFGLGRAAATVTQMYLEDRPLPSDRLALLLGSDGHYAGPAGLAADAVVCHCANVTKRAIDQAWQHGARDLSALVDATRATTGCGSCTALVRELCAGAAGSEGIHST